ncbi:MAG: YceI family protein [Taibaiella sp.]|nr:YceI family protein [Taibaiella sp.]
MKKIILSIAALLTFGAVQAFTISQSWQMTNAYSIKFSSSSSGGIFKTCSGTILFDEANLGGSAFNVAIEVASINTGNAMMNKHAKSADWFDAPKYPQIKFASKKIVKAGSGYQVTGDLEMHGIKKEVTLPFVFSGKGTAAVFSGSFSVKRSDFHIGEAGGEVGDDIKLVVAIPVVKK